MLECKILRFIYNKVHGRAGGSSSCGPLMAQGGVQALEAMLFSLDEAQRAGLAPPGVRLGALVLDDCDSDTRGLEMALDFIKGLILVLLSIMQIIINCFNYGYLKFIK